MTRFTILSSAMSLPGQGVMSSDIDREFSLAEGTVERECGVRIRYRAERDVTPVSLGSLAAAAALEKAKLTPADVNYIICAGASPEQLVPCNAVLLHRNLQASPAALCFDIDQTCMSFATALNVVDALLQGDTNKVALIVTSEIASRGLNKKDLKTYALFGDAAVAYVIKGGGSSYILGSVARTLSEYADACEVVGGGMRLPSYEYTREQHQQYLFRMDGPTLFKIATKHLPQIVTELLKTHDLTMADMALTVPHQASLSAMRLIQRSLGIATKDCMEVIQDYGNCIAASMPMALHVAFQTDRLKSGDKVLLIGAGAGVTLGANILIV